jgi:large subunit ribosomal protein L29e
MMKKRPRDLWTERWRDRNWINYHHTMEVSWLPYTVLGTCLRFRIFWDCRIVKIIVGMIFGEQGLGCWWSLDSLALLPDPSPRFGMCIVCHQCNSNTRLFALITLQQKNTCAHNSTNKAHANGIKKAKRTKFVSTRGMDPKFLRNQKFAKKYNGSKRQHDE